MCRPLTSANWPLPASVAWAADQSVVVMAFLPASAVRVIVASIGALDQSVISDVVADPATDLLAAIPGAPAPAQRPRRRRSQRLPHRRVRGPPPDHEHLCRPG